MHIKYTHGLTIAVPSLQITATLYYWSEVKKSRSYPGTCAVILHAPYFHFSQPTGWGKFQYHGQHYWCLVGGEEKWKLSRNVGCDLAPYLHFLTAHRLREVSVPRLMLLMSSRRSHTHTETYSAIQTVKYGLRTRKATAVNFLRKEDILHNRISPSLVRNMAGAYKQQREVSEDRTEEAAAKRHRLDVPDELPLITRHLWDKSKAQPWRTFPASLKEPDKQVSLRAKVAFL